MSVKMDETTKRRIQKLIAGFDTTYKHCMQIADYWLDNDCAEYAIEWMTKAAEAADNQKYWERVLNS